jgi:uncharacterized integral membrane protein (TIGR00698 family)
MTVVNRSLSAFHKNFSGTVPIVLPGIALSGLVALGGYAAATAIAPLVPIPAMLLALCLGIALNPAVTRLSAEAGLTFCLKGVLRWAVALLGLRVALSDIVDIGLANASIDVVAMALTVMSGFAFARWSGHVPGFGALAGVATGICGASAALAASSVIPEYKGKKEDVAFVIVAVNALATIGMLVYPPLCVFLGFDAQQTGVMLGGTIHDVAQVAAAGYAMSTDTGNAAVIVKLFRVFLLLPVVLAVRWHFSRAGAAGGDAKVPVPLFAVAFVLLCFLNSAMPYVPGAVPVYAPIKSVLVDVSTWGLLLAIGALGLSTSMKAIANLGWRHCGLVFGTTVVVLVVVTAGLLAAQL